MTPTYTRSACAYCEQQSGLYLADCRGCAIRAVQRSPQHFAAKAAGKITPAYRDLLERRGLTHEEVKAAAQETQR